MAFSYSSNPEYYVLKLIQWWVLFM